MSNANVPDNSETYIEAEEASAGQAQRMDPNAVRARAEVPNLLTQQRLDERQSNLREKRRGPSVEEVEEVPAAPSDVPPTECADAPSESH